MSVFAHPVLPHPQHLEEHLLLYFCVSFKDHLGVLSFLLLPHFFIGLERVEHLALGHSSPQPDALVVLDLLGFPEHKDKVPQGFKSLHENDTFVVVADLAFLELLVLGGLPVAPQRAHRLAQEA